MEIGRVEEDSEDPALELFLLWLGAAPVWVNWCLEAENLGSDLDELEVGDACDADGWELLLMECAVMLVTDQWVVEPVEGVPESVGLFGVEGELFAEFVVGWGWFEADFSIKGIGPERAGNRVGVEEELVLEVADWGWDGELGAEVLVELVQPVLKVCGGGCCAWEVGCRAGVATGAVRK